MGLAAALGQAVAKSAGAPWQLENGSLKVTVSPGTLEIAVLDKRNG
jgi:hypothetical protein